MTDNGDQFAMTAGLDAQDAKAVLGVVVGNTLDETS